MTGNWETENEDFLPEGLWQLEDAELRDLYEKPLRELITIGYCAGEESRIGVRSFPTALLSWWRDVSNEKGISLSKLQRITINHGISIASHDLRIKEVMKLYTSKIREAKNKRDRQAIKVLEEKSGTLSFISEMKYATSVGLMKWAEGPISAISATLGLPVTKLIIYLSLLSMMTLEECNWKEMLKEELELFWKYVEQRAKTLR
jgi:hypothetical protein